MSADNWEICPRCVNRAVKAKADQVAEVVASRDKVPESVFTLAMTAVRPVDEEDYREFREDYGFYIKDGKVHVEYSGNCQTCGLSVDFGDAFPIPGGWMTDGLLKLRGVRVPER